MRLTPALAALALAAACSSGSSPTTAPTPSQAASAPAPSATPTQDPFSAVTPPDSPGIGSFDPGTSNHAYLIAQGLLAEALFERSSLLGTEDAQLASDLAGTAKSPSVLAALKGATAAGLRFRPRFTKGVTVPASFAQVVRSDWGGEPVSTPDGGTAMRITWDGAIRYSVVYRGTPVKVAYTLSTSWVFTPKTVEINGVDLVTAVPGTFHAAPQVDACTAKGVLVPAGPAPTDADFGTGPYPAGGKGTCPV
jgi:hypothetical protein